MDTAVGTRPLILASSSPRRQELLREAGYAFVVVPPRADAESAPRPGEPIAAAVQRLACEKAADVAARQASGLILAADTLVECGGEWLGKPRDRADARRILTQLASRPHRVLTGLCLWDAASGRRRTGYAESWLQMRTLSPAELEAYLDSQRWEGKAGAFGYQDGNDWVTLDQGSASNVVGLPLELLAEMLADGTDQSK